MSKRVSSKSNAGLASGNQKTPPACNKADIIVAMVREKGLFELISEHSSRDKERYITMKGRIMHVELKDAAEWGTNYRLSGWTGKFVGFEGVAPSRGKVEIFGRS